MHPTKAEIRTHSYFIWERSGRSHGHDLDDWLQAETELRGMQSHDVNPQKDKGAKAGAAKKTATGKTASHTKRQAKRPK